MSLTIAIDFDDTITADVNLWAEFIELAVARGHNVLCISQRRDTEENHEIVDNFLVGAEIHIPFYFTSLQSKLKWAETRGLTVDIWIDDYPFALVNGRW